MKKKKLSIIIMIIALFATTTHAEILLCDANIRDANGNIIGTASCGDTVIVTGYDECTGRVIVYDETTGVWGTVVDGALGDCYYEPETYYDDYDCYVEDPDVYYDDCDYEYTEYLDEGCEEYQTYPDCAENYEYTECLEDSEYDCVEQYQEQEIDYEEPVEYEEPYCTDYGDKWVDIDLATQMITVYSGTYQVLASCCVTGMAGVMDTPCGVWSILDKQRNATLIGDDYECPVDFWMPFTGSGCGIHDATWRDDFSPDAYTYAGSHGCVNVGYDTAGAIYDLVDCGTSVVVHY